MPVVRFKDPAGVEREFRTAPVGVLLFGLVALFTVEGVAGLTLFARRDDALCRRLGSKCA
jgi:hypothetical protein